MVIKGLCRGLPVEDLVGSAAECGLDVVATRLKGRPRPKGGRRLR